MPGNDGVTSIVLLFLLTATLGGQNSATATFPSALFSAAPEAATVLTGAITSVSQPVFQVASASRFIPPTLVRIDSEVVAICSKTTLTLVVCTVATDWFDGRGFSGTSAATHTLLNATTGLATPVTGTVDRSFHNRLAAEVKAMESYLSVAGIHCNGTTDDTAVIQSAIDAAGSIKGTVVIPASASGCRITTSLNINDDNVTIIGANRGASLIYTGASPVNEAMIRADGRSNIRVRNLTLNGGDRATASFAYGVYFTNTTQSSVEGVRFTGFAPGTAWTSYMLRFGDGVTLSHATNNVFDGETKYSGGTGCGGGPCLVVGILFDSPLVDAYNGQVSGSTPLAPTNLTNQANGNILYGLDYGIQVDNAADIQVGDNDLSAQVYRGIRAGYGTTRIDIHDNSVKNSGSTPILLAFGVSYVQVTGNVITGALGAEGIGIEAYYGVSNLDILGNTISKTATGCILLGYKASDVTISGNRLNLCVGPGVQITGALPSVYDVSLPGGGGVSNISVVDNIIDATGAQSSIRVQTFVAGSALGNVTVSSLTIASNRLSNGDYGVMIYKNPAAPALNGVLVLANTYYAQAFSSIYSDYEGSYQLAGSAASGTGTWGTGSIVWYTTPGVDGSVGAVCTAGGNPGVWRSFGRVGTVHPSIDSGDPLNALNPNGQVGADTNGGIVASDTASRSILRSTRDCGGSLATRLTTDSIETTTAGMLTVGVLTGTPAVCACFDTNGKSVSPATASTGP